MGTLTAHGLTLPAGSDLATRANYNILVNEIEAMMVAHEASSPAAHATGSITTAKLAAGAATGAVLGADVVVLTGAQAITGPKTLTAPIIVGRLVANTVGASTKPLLNPVPVVGTVQNISNTGTVTGSFTMTGVPNSAVAVAFSIEMNTGGAGTIIFYGQNASNAPWIGATVPSTLKGYCAGIVPIVAGTPTLNYFAAFPGSFTISFFLTVYWEPA